MFPFQLPGELCSASTMIPHSMSSSAKLSRWPTAIFRVQFNALLIDTFPGLLNVTSGWSTKNLYQKVLLKLFFARTFSAYLDSFLPTRPCVTARTCLLIWRVFTMIWVTSFLLIGCRHLFLFFMCRTMAFSSEIVTTLQYSFSSPIPLLPSSLLSMVLLSLIRGNSPLFTAE